MKKWLSGLLAGALAALTFAPAARAAQPESLKAHFIDVGQADSVFLELPGSKTMLIDAGNNGDGDAVTGYIKSLGYTRIDTVVGTHPHEDHIGGMDDVIRAFDIGAVWMPDKTTTTKTFEDVLLAIQKKGLKITRASAGKTILSDGALRVDLLAPVASDYGDDLNRYSAVVKVTYGGNAMLFTGDATAETEAEITADVKADVLKVGHHGSDTSTSQAFLDRVKPSIAVISVGTGNTYGHPADVTLSRLEQAGAAVYRTDESGTVIVTSDGEKLSVETKGRPIQPQAPPAPKASVKTPATPEPAAESIGTTVYVTDTGKKYHAAGCSYLKKSQREIDLSTAKKQGYTACSKCHPPQ